MQVSRLFCIICALLSFVAFSERASAAVRPYSARGTAHFINATDFVGSGYATHLGPYGETGSVSFAPTQTPGVFHVEGAIIYTAANGNELHAVVSGELNGLTGQVSASIRYVGGTGRFADASGSARLSGQLGPNQTISVLVRGTIDY